MQRPGFLAIHSVVAGMLLVLVSCFFPSAGVAQPPLQPLPRPFGNAYHPVGARVMPRGTVPHSAVPQQTSALNSSPLRQAWYRISSEPPQRAGTSVVWLQDGEEGESSSDEPESEDDSMQSGSSASFEMYCLDCHDADRALQKSKSYGDWLTTVRRMAAMDDANIPSSEFEPIARYLADVAGIDGAGGGAGDGNGGGSGGGSSGISWHATVSALWRGGNHGYQSPAPSGELDHAGFFPDVWVGLQWQNGPLSARATVCTSCHNESPQDGHFFEIVNATLKLDLMQALAFCYEGDISASVEAGRFVAPFGAFAGMSHPATYRTVSNPLIYAMGRTVETGNFNTPRPVLPHPYSDEGVRGKLSVPIGQHVTATLDTYAINGLRPRFNDRFLSSRTYWDNNNDPAVGGRATIGNKTLRLGGSIMSGHLNNDRDPQQYYKLAGADVTFRYEKWIRAYAEYAIRTEETSPGARSHTYGTVVEGEMQLTPCVSLLARYDTLYARGAIISGGRPDDIDRATWGVNFTMPGGSELLFNHEIWRPEIGPNVDVVGFRWFATF